MQTCYTMIRLLKFMTVYINHSRIMKTKALLISQVNKKGSDKPAKVHSFTRTVTVQHEDWRKTSDKEPELRSCWVTSDSSGLLFSYFLFLFASHHSYMTDSSVKCTSCSTESQIIHSYQYPSPLYGIHQVLRPVFCQLILGL